LDKGFVVSRRATGGCAHIPLLYHPSEYLRIFREDVAYNEQFMPR